jgi:hypothetical protein
LYAYTVVISSSISHKRYAVEPYLASGARRQRLAHRLNPELEKDAEGRGRRRGGRAVFMAVRERSEARARGLSLIRRPLNPVGVANRRTEIIFLEYP